MRLMDISCGRLNAKRSYVSPGCCTYFDAGAISQNTPRRGVPPFKRPNAIVQDRSDVGALLHLRSYFRTYGWVTVLILGAFGVIYISDIRESQTQLEGKLVQERERSASLMKKAQLLQASMVPLTLVSRSIPKCRRADSPGRGQAFNPTNHSGYCPTRRYLRSV